jgi:hypothetical protein
MDNLLPAHRALLSLYQAHTRPNVPPLFDDFRLSELTPHLAHLAVLAREGADAPYIFTAAGADIIGLLGADPIGKAAISFAHPSQIKSIRRLQAAIETDRHPKVVRGQLRSRTAAPDILERLILPCVDRTEALSHLLLSMRPFPV